MEKDKEKEVNLDDLDPIFVINSFKNKERRNNPSAIPRVLLPPTVQARRDEEKEEEETNSTTLSNESDKVDTISTAGEAPNVTDNAKRTTSRQRKSAFDEYQKTFLQTPKIINRKPVFISESTRERLNKIARKLGDANMSASGFLENLALHHLNLYEEDFEQWRKL